MAARENIFGLWLVTSNLSNGWAFPWQGEVDSAFTFAPSLCGWAPIWLIP